MFINIRNYGITLTVSDKWEKLISSGSDFAFLALFLILSTHWLSRKVVMRIEYKYTYRLADVFKVDNVLYIRT